ncbi:C39 family peptidase [Lysobacter sp. S4-A87]|uniref:C39 family peptidase n=1 Tax=Lysobacter sp. S4-A87 TaxID=2925843 RepID=UPI001F52D2A4|nr:C39 family peptidase [Lysobacter sp. S4-A87]UNK49957.1 C39 family peptidase [Lysobacter sp. S4-A87]
MSVRNIRSRAVLAASVWILFAGLAQAGKVDVRVNGAPYRMQVVSLKEARFQTTVPQQYDFSCGSAATATLLTYQYGIPVTEAEVFMHMYQSGDQAKIKQRGFSLLDMRRYLKSRGFEADGFEQPLDKLFQEGLPAIVLLNDRGYKHFVVVKGLRNGRILLGDPARGTRAMPRSRFEELWDNKILFVIHNRREIAGFNLARDWRTAPPAPLDAGIARDSLYNIVTPRKRPGDI